MNFHLNTNGPFQVLSCVHDGPWSLCSCVERDDRPGSTKLRPGGELHLAKIVQIPHGNTRSLAQDGRFWSMLAHPFWSKFSWTFFGVTSGVSQSVVVAGMKSSVQKGCGMHLPCSPKGTEKALGAACHRRL